MSDSPYEQRRRRAQQRQSARARAGDSRSESLSEPLDEDHEPEHGAGGQPDPEVVEAARNIVLRQLTASAKSRQQLEDKLADRAVPEAVAMAVLDRFEEVGLVDDVAFAQMFVRSRAETRKLARAALRRDLQAKGIDPRVAEQALEQRTDDQEREDALELVRRKAPSGQQLFQQLAERTTRDKLTRRLVSMLARKGYSPGLAFEVVKEVLTDLEQELDH